MHWLAGRAGSAPENMALDFLLLQRYALPEAVRFRHYTWRQPAVTFGFGQKIAFVRGQVSAGVELCRRPTGGGIVDHRNDWTYALALPRKHPGYAERAQVSYRQVHAALADALIALGEPVDLQEGCASGGETGPAGVCFQRAEPFDVIHRPSGRKVAGAAQKRAKSGLLFQGSIERGALGEVDWGAFETLFAARLAAALGAELESRGQPEFNPDEESGLIDQYSSPEWIEYR